MRLDRLSLGLLVLLATSAAPSRSQSPPTTAAAGGDDVSSLIDRLQDIAEGDIGYMPTMSGTGFLPLGSSRPSALLLDQGAPVSSMALRELVKRGAAAVPALIAHLDDQRTTKITINREGFFGGMFFSDEYDYNRRTSTRPPEGVNRDEHFSKDQPHTHTVAVGDLCFVALGQIVNRRFEAVRYQPTACIMLNSPTYSEALRKVIRAEWGGLTPERHKALLIRDFLDPDHEDRRVGACLRLGYYYRDALEPLALRQLVAPRYDSSEVVDLIHGQLYRAEDAKERKQRLGAFLASHNPVVRDAILVRLFDDLYRQEADEEHRLSTALKDKYQARACLVELFGYPENVKARDCPLVLPLSNSIQARFISALAGFPSAKLDEAVRKILRSTEDDYLATACVRYLIGRGADADIKAYVEPRLKKADAGRRAELDEMLKHLGWTPLHVAAEECDPDRVGNLLAWGADINAQAANGETALHVAARHGSFGAIERLLSRGANPNVKDKEGRMPVQLAMRYEGAAEMLLAAGAEIPDILVAARAGRSDLVRQFIQNDKRAVNARTDEGETPLYIAALLGHDEVAKVLLAYGADVNAADNYQITPLHRAAEYGHAKVVALLLAHHANRNAKHWHGQTPADFARENRQDETLRLLEEAP